MARLLRVVLSTLLVLFASAPRPATQTPDIDILIRGGQVLDGSGAPATRADVGIRNGRIVAVGSLEGRTAAAGVAA